MLLPISVLGGLLQKDTEPKPSEVNLRTIALLTTTNSPSGSSIADEPIVDDGALVAENGPSGASADLSQHKPTSDQISIYVVHEGDTLSQIAEMFNVSVNTIRWTNDISGTGIRPGQTLIILPITGVRHTVAKGETLGSIAKKYKGDLDEIAGYNGLGVDASLAVGSVIIIPDGEIAAPAKSSGSTAPSSSYSGPSYAGYYVRPIPGAPKTQGLHGHNGVDFGGPVGTPVIAAASGDVIISRDYGWNGGYGNYVVIRHPNGTQTLYAHLSRNAAAAGESVEQGDVIGYVGATGKATGPHLHFEVRGAKNPF